MFAVLRFLFFNVALSTTDVGTDFFTFLELLVDNPRWACLTLLWTVMPFLVHTALLQEGHWKVRSLRQLD